MIKLKPIIITLVILIIAGVILFYNRNDQAIEHFDEARAFRELEPIKVDFDENLFYRAIAQPEKFKIRDRLVGATLPHHEIASDHLAKFFAQLAKEQSVDTFIILGPKHSDVAAWPAISAETYWQTSLGPVYQAESILDDLTESGAVVYDQENFIPEHSIKTIIPFVKYYFPEAKVAPIILTSRHDQSMSLALAQKISLLLEDKKTLILSSIDFSHYLDLETAERNDQITLEAIYNRDYFLLSNLNSDYLDSPPALIVLLEAMRLSETNDFELIDHSNSAKILGGDQNTTSYIIGYFSK